MNKIKFIFWGLVVAGAVAIKDVDGEAGYEKTEGYVYQTTSKK